MGWAQCRPVLIRVARCDTIPQRIFTFGISSAFTRNPGKNFRHSKRGFPLRSMADIGRVYRGLAVRPLGGAAGAARQSGRHRVRRLPPDRSALFPPRRPAASAVRAMHGNFSGRHRRRGDFDPARTRPVGRLASALVLRGAGAHRHSVGFRRGEFLRVSLSPAAPPVYAAELAAVDHGGFPGVGDGGGFSSGSEPELVENRITTDRRF